MAIEAFEVALGEDGTDKPGIAVLVVPEVNQLAVAKEDEGGFKFLRGGEGLCLGSIGVYGFPFRFDGGEWAAVAVVEEVVDAPGVLVLTVRNLGRLTWPGARTSGLVHRDGFAAETHGNFRAHLCFVGGVPPGLAQLLVDDDSGVGFRFRLAHRSFVIKRLDEYCRNRVLVLG
jgi:hypothetical protein